MSQSSYESAVPRWASSTEPVDLVEVYDELLALVGTAPDVDGFLRRVVHLAAQAVTPAGAASVIMRRDGELQSVAMTSPLATFADEVQYGLEDGPCLQCIRTGDVVAAADYGAEVRWGDYPQRARSQGVGGSLSLPLEVDGQTVGALNLYAMERGALGDAERERGLAFAARASGALALVEQRAGEARLTEQLQEALASRSVIDQALGVVMAQRKVDSEDAFAVLRNASSRTNRKLRDLAADIVAQASGEPLARPPQFRRPRQP